MLKISFMAASSEIRILYVPLSIWEYILREILIPIGIFGYLALSLNPALIFDPWLPPEYARNRLHFLDFTTNVIYNCNV